MKNDKIIIAGASGLIGSNLIEKANELGLNITGTYFKKKPTVDGDFINCNFTDYDDCIRATKNKDILIIAASIEVGIKIMKENPTANLLPNIKIVSGLLEAASENRIKRVILISSTSVYQPAFYPIKESDLDLNESPHQVYLAAGAYNRYIEQLADVYSKMKGIDIRIIRPTNAFGKYDHFSDENSHVIPALIKRAILKEDPFKIWGNGYEIRDFIYAEDLAIDILNILSLPENPGPVNSGSGKALSIREVLEIILNHVSHKPKLEFDLNKPVSIPFRAVDITKIESVCGKRKRISFEEGIQKTLEWYREHE